MINREFSSAASADELYETLLCYSGGLLVRQQAVAAHPARKYSHILSDDEVRVANDYLSDLGLGKAHTVSVDWLPQEDFTQDATPNATYSPYIRYETVRLTTIFSLMRAPDGAMRVRKRLEPPEDYAGIVESDVESDPTALSQNEFNAFVTDTSLDRAELDEITTLDRLFTALF